KSKIVAWAKMKKMLKATFLPYNYQSLMYQRLQNLRQGTRTVNDYADEFYQLIARNDIMETEEQLTARFVGGLRIQIQDMVNMFDPRSVAEAHQKALAWEKQGRRGGGVMTSSNIQGKGASGSSNVSKTVP
ncbi:retrotransposon gag domain-containing protein, partial [Pseudomonas aeruginosa]|uniref:retrotransposon gag family protein n=1 Tax=Pseudomonas aeruginosa TaxID=287 RepID=UPI0027D42427